MAPQQERPGAVGGAGSRATGGGGLRVVGGVGPRAALLAALAAVAAFCAGDAAVGNYPFGHRSRAVNDLGNQYIPYHAHLWDLLHGRADGGILLNWQSGYGTSFLPDLGTYLTSPFALLVGLFPRDRIDVAVYVITVLKIGAAAAAMACALLVLKRGRWWVAGGLGASYALCGWTLSQASYNLMWLDGLIGFPLLCIAGEWARRRQRPVLSVGVVALVWTANFYTAYMATVGAGLVLIARLLTDRDSDIREKLFAFGRGVISMVLGIGLTAPVLLTIVKGTHMASPLPPDRFQHAPWADLLVRMLPGTYSFGLPATYLDTAALLLAFVLPFHPAVPRRTRAVWTCLTVAVTLSVQWGPTHLFWHAFQAPNGSQFRQTFVLSGLMVIAAWFAVGHGLPGWRPLAYGSGVMAAVVAVCALQADKGLAGPATYPAALAGTALVAGAVLLLRRSDRLRGAGAARVATALPAALAAGLLLLTQVGQSAFSNAWADQKRFNALDDYAAWGQRQTWQRETIEQADGWPAYRTDPGREQTVGNDPLAVGGQGAAYYSSHTPDVWNKTLIALGGGWTSRGRSLQSLDNPVTDVVFSVGARLHSPPDPHQRATLPQTAPPTVTRQAVPPLVTVRAAGPAGAYGRSPYRNQGLLLGTNPYTAGPVQLLDSAGRPVHAGRGGFEVTGSPSSADWQRSTYRLDSYCPAGSEIYFWSPYFMGSAHLTAQPTVKYVGRMITHRAPVQKLGTAPPGGHFILWVRAMAPGTLDPEGVGCLDRAKLAQAEQRLAATGATHVSVTDDGISAQLPPGAHGFAIVAAPAIKGWRCSAGGGPSHPAQSYLGLLSVPIGDGDTGISCSFTPPGLPQGEAVAGGSLLGLAGLIGYGWWRRRRPAAGGAEASPAAPVASAPRPSELAG